MSHLKAEFFFFLLLAEGVVNEIGNTRKILPFLLALLMEGAVCKDRGESSRN